MFSYFVIYFLLICFWLHWVCTAAGGLSLAEMRWAGATLCSHVQVSRCSGFPRCREWALGHAGALVVVAHGVFPDQGLNSCSLHWQADFLRLDHQESPLELFWQVCYSRQNSSKFQVCRKRYGPKKKKNAAISIPWLICFGELS